MLIEKKTNKLLLWFDDTNEQTFPEDLVNENCIKGKTLFYSNHQKNGYLSLNFVYHWMNNRFSLTLWFSHQKKAHTLEKKKEKQQISLMKSPLWILVSLRVLI